MSGVLPSTQESHCVVERTVHLNLSVPILPPRFGNRTETGSDIVAHEKAKSRFGGRSRGRKARQFPRGLVKLTSGLLGAPAVVESARTRVTLHPRAARSYCRR